MKVAVVTANIGGYEKTIGDPVDQVLASDFVLFTDDPARGVSRWRVVTTPYHRTLSQDSGCRNSIRDLYSRESSAAEPDATRKQAVRNMMSAKFYKMNHYAIPLLEGYDVIVWLDANFRILNPRFTEICSRLHGGGISVFKHSLRNTVAAEVEVSAGKEKYREQHLEHQWRVYRGQGFPDDNGLMECGFLVCDAKDERVRRFLRTWWIHNLRHSFQDQVSFPFVCWKLGFTPRVLTEGTIYRNRVIGEDWTECYVRHGG